MSTNRVRKDRGRVNHQTLPKGPHGRALCRYCKKEVPASRKTFCSAVCVHEWKLRTQPGYLRACTLKRDDGRCAKCKRDSIVLGLEMQILKRKDRKAWEKWYRDHGIPLTRKSMWDVDHVLEVCNGGGECGLSEVQTLCVICHLEKTTFSIKTKRKVGRS